MAEKLEAVEVELTDLSSDTTEPKQQQQPPKKPTKEEDEKGWTTGEEDELFPLAPFTLLKLEEEKKEFVVPPWDFKYLLFFVLVYFVVFVGMVVVVIVDLGGDSMEVVSVWWILFFFYVPEIVKAGMPIVLSYFQGNGAFIDFGISFRSTDFGWGLAYGVLSVVLGGVSLLLTCLVVGFPDEDDDEVKFGGVMAEILFFIGFGIVGPIGEEILFRGFFFSILAKDNLHYILLIIVNSVSSSIFHLRPFRLLILFVNGVLMNTARVHTQSLTPCLVAHILRNLIIAAIALLFVSVDDGDSTKKATRFLFFEQNPVYN